MEPTKSPFAITVLPWRGPAGKPGSYLSLCVELNRHFDHSAIPFATWYEMVRSYHGGAPSLYENLCTQIRSGAFKIGGAPAIPGTPCTAPVMDCAISLWSEMFPAGKTVHALWQPVRAPQFVAGPAPLGSDSVTGSPIVRAEPKGGGATTMQVGDKVNAMLTSGPLAGVRTLTQEERRRIRDAAERVVAETTRRLDLAQDAAARGLKVASADRSLGSVVARVSSDMQLAMNVFASTVECVHTLFDSLNASPQLCRIFGTTIDVYLPDVSVPSGDFTVEFTPGGLEFHSLPTALTRVKVGAATPLSDLMVVESSTAAGVLESGLLQLGGEHARVFCVEPQSLASSAEEVARDVAYLPREILESSLLESQRDRDALRQAAIDAKPAAAREAHAYRAMLRARREQQAFLVRTNNRQTNTPTRGLVVYHTDVKALMDALETDAGTADGAVSTVDAAGALHGFVVYVRRIDGSGQKSDWMPLTTVSESLRWRKDTAGTCKDTEYVDIDLGLHVGGAVHASDPTALPNQPTVYELRDGFILAWDGTGLSAQSQLRQRERGEGATAADDATAAMEAVERSNRLNTPEMVAAQRLAGDLITVKWCPADDQGAPEEAEDRTDRGETPRLVACRSEVTSFKGPFVKLSFDAQAKYEMLAVAQYHNGYVPLDLTTLNSHADDFSGSSTRRTPFVRYDHIRDVVVALEEEIYANRDQKAIRSENAGESETHLVVRTGTLLDTGRCTRLLLPPPLPTFQTYLWYRGSDLKRMGPPRHAGDGDSDRLSRALDEEQLAAWHERYNCEARTELEFAKNKRRAQEMNVMAGTPLLRVRGCAMGCRKFCGGLTQPPVYDGRLRYLPDPVVVGLRIAFFEDEAGAVPGPSGYAMKDCFYRHGSYPNLRPWRLVVEKLESRGEPVEMEEGSQTLTVRLPPGKTLYVRATPMYDPRKAHFAPSLLRLHGLEDVLKSATVDTESTNVFVADETHANVATFTLTHAVQRPLSPPRLGPADTAAPRWAHVRRFNPFANAVPPAGAPPLKAAEQPPTAAMFELDVDVAMEWLNFVGGAPDPTVAPTGDVELFALWDDYDDHHDGPSLPIEEKIDRTAPADGFVRVAILRRYDLARLSDATSPRPLRDTKDEERYVLHATFRSDHAPFTTAQHTRVRFRVRNTSSFFRYFHVGSAMSEQDVEEHSYWSNERDLDVDFTEPPEHTDQTFRAVLMPGNVKPDCPTVHKIVGLVTRDADRRAGTLRYCGNRVRVFMRRDGRQSTGPERIGILVAAGANPEPGPFVGFLSRGGQDIVTDGPLPSGTPLAGTPSLLGPDAFVLDDRLESEYCDRFEPWCESDPFASVAKGVGLVSYRPRFDTNEGLWYVDIELAVLGRAERELHNPFVQLGLVTYQPRGCNYVMPALGDKSMDPLRLDFRVSTAQLSEYFSIYPSRTLNEPLVLFGSGRGDACTLSGALSSLYFQGASLRTQFVAEVQRCEDGAVWRSFPSRLQHWSAVVDGKPIDADVQHAAGEQAVRHLLLPQATAPGSSTARFECAFSTRFDTGFLDSPRSGTYRVLVREVDWYPRSDGDSWREVQKRLQGNDAAQIPDLHTRQVMLLTPR